MSGNATASDGLIVIATVVSIVEAIVFLIFGIAAIFFGTSLPTLIILFQSLIASGYRDLIDAVLVGSLGTLDVIFNRTVSVVTGTLGLAFTAIQKPMAASVLQGVLIGFLLAEPLLQLARDVLFRFMLGCTGYGARTVRFPAGEPVGCDRDSLDFIMYYYATFGLNWLVAAVAGWLCMMNPGKALALSAAVTGANALTDGGVKLAFEVLRILSGHAAASEARTILAGAAAGTTYVLAAIGAIVMLCPSVGNGCVKLPLLAQIGQFFQHVERRLADSPLGRTSEIRIEVEREMSGTPKRRSTRKIAPDRLPPPSRGSDAASVSDLASVVEEDVIGAPVTAGRDEEAELVERRRQLRRECLKLGIDFSISDSDDTLERKLMKATDRHRVDANGMMRLERELPKGGTWEFYDALGVDV